VASLATHFVVGAAWFALLFFSPQRHHLAAYIAAYALAAASGLAVLALAIRLSGVGMRQYLGLIPPRLRDVGLGLAVLAAIYFTFWLVSVLIGLPLRGAVISRYRLAEGNGSLAVLLFNEIIASPVYEELLIRGFLYHGFAASRLGPTGAVVVTSAVWAVVHMQYDWFVRSKLFCIGLLFGAIRQRGGSTATTTILHATWNGWPFLYFVLVDWLGLVAGP
jgi:membrane protease YdiL (CAAX protease family)